MADHRQPRNKLSRTPSGKWSLNGRDFGCGSVFQVKVAGHWIEVSVEHDGRDYYAIPLAIRLHKGLEARLLSDYDDEITTVF